MQRSRPPATDHLALREQRRRWVCILLTLGIIAAPLSAEQEAHRDPWVWLGEARDALATEPLSASFTQAFRPAGFSGEDSESGKLHLDLPRCVRWDYLEPFAKSYLLCDEIVFVWNEGESSGRRFAIRAAEQPGIDLMTLRVDLLRERYEAQVVTVADDRTELTLVPLETASDLMSATVILDPADRRPIRIEYTDRQGNRTRFDIADYAPLEDSGHFEPPAEIEWLEP